MHSVLAIAALLLTTAGAWGQAWTPPYCTGANMALQYNEKGWQCVKIVGEPGPAGPAGPALPAQPPPTQCITSNWNGTTWACVPTVYLEAK